MAAIMVDGHGVRPGAGTNDVEAAVAAQTFFWLDVVGESEAAAVALMKAAGLDDAEIAAAVRFRQTGRLRVARDRLRVVTWIGDPEGGLIEFHLVGFARGIVSLWSGDETLLDTIRRRMSFRASAIGTTCPTPRANCCSF